MSIYTGARKATRSTQGHPQRRLPGPRISGDLARAFVEIVQNPRGSGGREPPPNASDPLALACPGAAYSKRGDGVRYQGEHVGDGHRGSWLKGHLRLEPISARSSSHLFGVSALMQFISFSSLFPSAPLEIYLRSLNAYSGYESCHCKLTDRRLQSHVLCQISTAH